MNARDRMMANTRELSDVKAQQRTWIEEDIAQAKAGLERLAERMRAAGMDPSGVIKASNELHIM
jgi:hypothetical protein